MVTQTIRNFDNGSLNSLQKIFRLLETYTNT